MTKLEKLIKKDGYTWEYISGRHDFTDGELAQYENDIDWGEMKLNKHLTTEQAISYARKFRSNRSWYSRHFSNSNIVRLVDHDRGPEFIRELSSCIDREELTRYLKTRHSSLAEGVLADLLIWNYLKVQRFSKDFIVRNVHRFPVDKYELGKYRNKNTHKAWTRIFNHHEFTIEEVEQMAEKSIKEFWAIVGMRVYLDKDKLFEHFQKIVDALELDDVFDILNYLNKETLKGLIDDGFALLLELY